MNPGKFMRYFLFLFYCLIHHLSLGQQQTDFNLSLVGHAEPEIPDSVPSQYHQFNDVWGWTSTDCTEYAIFGTGYGTAIYRLSDPTNPELITVVPGAYSRWRDFKSFGDYIYVVADEGSDGLLIIDMSAAPDAVTFKHWTPDLPILGTNPTLRKCHNLSIDSCYAYLAGCNNGSPRNLGVFIIDLCTDPLNPQYITHTDSIYAHDAYAQGDRLYLSNLGSGFSIVDISNKSAPITLALQETSSDFTHNAWSDTSGHLLFTTDERFRAYVDAYDISNPDEIQLLDRWRPAASEVQGAIPHNVHYLDGYLVVSYYTDGLKIVDANRPTNLVEVASYDTYFFRDGSFGGHWGAYPYLPSGLVLSSDRSSGLYVFEPNYQRAAYLEGLITDSLTGEPLPDVKVTFLSEFPGSDVSGTNGSYATGLAMAGKVDVEFFIRGYHRKTISVDLVQGEVTDLDVQLVPLAFYTVRGRVLDDSTGEPVSFAEVSIFNDIYHDRRKADAEGHFEILTFEGDRVIAAGKWGYLHNFSIETVVGDLNEIEIRLSRGYRDDFIFDLGWTVSSSITTPERQRWQRGTPAYYVYDAEFANPDADISDDLGSSCYVTGLEGSPAGNLSDTSILTSPVFNLTDYSEPYLYYFTWFYDKGVNPPDDQLEIWLDNGTERVMVEKITESGSTWRPRSEIRVADYLTPSTTMQLILIAADTGSVHLYEAGIDAFSITDGQTTSSQWLEGNEIRVFPNPFSEEIHIRFENAPRGTTYRIIDLLGREAKRGVLSEALQSIPTLDLTTGFHFLTIEVNGKILKTEKILKN